VRYVCAELTQEVSRLQAELNKIKLQEFEAQEQTVDLTSELEEERRGRKRAEQELKVITPVYRYNIISLNRKMYISVTHINPAFYSNSLYILNAAVVFLNIYDHLTIFVAYVFRN